MQCFRCNPGVRVPLCRLQENKQTIFTRQTTNETTCCCLLVKVTEMQVNM